MSVKYNEINLSHFLVSNPSAARVRTQHWTRRFIHICRFECIYWTIWGRASKPRGDNFARRVAQLSASAKYVTLMVIIPLSLRLTVTSVTRNIALIPWCAQPLCDTYKCSTQMAQMCAAPTRRVAEEYLNALVNARPDFLVKQLLHVYKAHTHFSLDQLDFNLICINKLNCTNNLSFLYLTLF